jgi:hypothetical protein
MWWLMLVPLVLLLVWWLVKRRVQVVISRYSENVDWKNRLMYDSVVYEKNKPGYKYNIPVNKGNEASVYFKYIVDHYHSLPEYVIFVHGHESDWHHKASIVDTIHSLSFQNGYANINDTDQTFELCKTSKGFNVKNFIKSEQVDEQDVYDHGMDEWWREAMEEYFGKFDGKVVSDTCCAQFVVSRDAILRHPLSFYEKQYNWLVTTDIENAYSGRFYEWTWKYIFTTDHMQF